MNKDQIRNVLNLIFMIATLFNDIVCVIKLINVDCNTKWSIC